MNPTLRNLPTLLIQAALVTAVSVLALVLVTRYVTPIPLSINQVTTQKDSAFSVTGESSISTEPDKVEVTLGVSKQERDIKVAQQSANQIIDGIKKSLIGLGVQADDIKTQNYSINPSYDWNNPGRPITGYSVEVSLLVSMTDFAALNQAIDAATAAGANQIGGIRFTLSEEKEAQVKSQAREEAIANAKKNANDLAQLSGIKLGRVINVTEGSNVGGPVMPFAARDAVMNAGAGGGAPTNIEPGKTNYDFTVTLSYETL